MLSLFVCCALFWGAVLVVLQFVFKLLIKQGWATGMLGAFLFLLKTATFFCLYVFFVLLGWSLVDFALGVLFSFLLIVAWVLLLWRLGFLL